MGRNIIRRPAYYQLIKKAATFYFSLNLPCDSNLILSIQLLCINSNIATKETII